MTLHTPPETDRHGWFDGTITIRARVRQLPNKPRSAQAEFGDGLGSGHYLQELPASWPGVLVQPALPPRRGPHGVAGVIELDPDRPVETQLLEALAAGTLTLNSSSWAAPANPHLDQPTVDAALEAFEQGDVPDDGDRSDPWESPAASDSTDGDGPSTTATTTPSESASAPAADTAPEPEPKDKRPTTGKTVAGSILSGVKPEEPVEDKVFVVTEEEARAGVPSNDGPTGRTHLFHTPDGPVDCLCQLGTDHGDPTT